MGLKMLIDIWGKVHKIFAAQNRAAGIEGISSFEADEPEMKDKTAEHMATAMGLYEWKGDWYTRIISQNGEEVISIRISDHASTGRDFKSDEMVGLPNRRYSLVISNEKNTSDADDDYPLIWQRRDIAGITLYEAIVGCNCLKKHWQYLCSELRRLYDGEHCEKSFTIK